MTQPPTMYNRRLTKSELVAWLQMEHAALSMHGRTWTDDFTRSFFELPSTILYLATVNGEAVGGTAMYRDTVRSGLSLVSVIVRPEQRDKLLNQVVRSSLPFFRSATIKQVEALVGTAGKQGSIHFPQTYMLEHDMATTLRNTGFVTVGAAWQYSVRLPKLARVRSTLRLWDAKPNANGARKLLLEQGERGGLACSHIRLALDLAVSRGSLKTITVKGRTQLACGFEAHGDEAFIPFLSLDSEMMNMEAAASQLLDLSILGKTDTIRLPLVGKSESECVGTLADLTKSSCECDSMNLMIKVL